MSSRSAKKIRRFRVGALPLIDVIIRRMRLAEILAEHIPVSGREAISSVDVLLLLVANLTLAKDPLYELGQWVDSLDLRVLGYRGRPSARFSDDRFARALDKLYETDRSALMTAIVVSAIQAFDVQLARIHNDSTSVKAFGRIPGRTRDGLELSRGYSKDHRPDLKQLVYCLSISADGAVPVHHKVYSGNRNDETTHIETWETLASIHGNPAFLYVADCKLCTKKQLSYITDHGGKAITVLPEQLMEVRRFKDALRKQPKPKKAVWRRPKPSDESATEYFHVFDGAYQMDYGGYAIHWFVSSEKRKRDRFIREQNLCGAEAALSELAPKLNAYRLKRKAAIQKKVTAILKKYQVEKFLNADIRTHMQRLRKRKPGRPPKLVQYQYRNQISYSLEWSRNRNALQAEKRIDGIFPLLCTDSSIPPKQVLQAWKFQPQIEKRFSQFKNFHRAAPLLFKKIHRVEANMFVFFIALMVQALLERSVRRGLRQRKAPPLKLYPEDRDAPHPTTSQIFKTFDGLSSYAVIQDDRILEEYRDDLNPTHRALLSLISIDEDRFWNAT